MENKKITQSLMFRFAMLFAIIFIVVLVITGIATFYAQMGAYKRQCQRNVQSVGAYLTSLMRDEGQDIVAYRDYYMKHYKEIDIPYAFDDYEDAWKEYESVMAREYPGKVLGKDITLEELSDEAKKAYMTYTHEYWLLTFEKAREEFNLPYTYFLVMVDSEETREEMGYDVDFVTEERDNVVYMIDGERTHREDDPQLLYLGDTYFNPRETYEFMWRTWDTGEVQNGYMEWNNNWGHTYGYYTPLIIDGERIGLVVTEVQVEDVNREILANTLTQLAIVMIVFVFGMVVLMIFIRDRLIRRVAILEGEVARYSGGKDPEVADSIRNMVSGSDEIDSLAIRFASMIDEVRDYINNLSETRQELRDTRIHAEMLSEQANRDSLTGIRNKNAYDTEAAKLQAEMDDGFSDFGIAMIDLNFLKKINDTYGHDKGNTSIARLCRIVCEVFEHSPVFRIGGDEFVVILKGSDFNNRESLVAQFEREVIGRSADESLDPWERVSAAIGVGVCRKGTDIIVADVLRRADELMYHRKKEMKADREVEFED